MSACEIRHIQRCRPDDPGAVAVGRVHFRAAPLEGVNGDGGWISAEVSRALSDDGSLRIRFPNGNGGDGSPHRRRFAILTQDAYRIGDEWLEVRREAGKLMSVCSPASWEINGNEIVLTCTDVLALTTLTRDETLHPWCAPPRDVLDYYGRLEMPWALKDFAGWSVTGAGVDGAWSYTNVAPSPSAHVRLNADASILYDVGVFPAAATESWTASFVGSIDGSTLFLLYVFGSWVLVYPDQHAVKVSVGNGDLLVDGVSVVRPDITVSARFSCRVYRRGEWMFFQWNGETVATMRAGYLPTQPTEVAVLGAAGGAVDLEQISVTTTERQLVRADQPGDLQLPGAPPRGGLAGRYFLETDAKARCSATFDYTQFARLFMNPLQEPYAYRVDRTIDFAAADPPTWQPPGPTSGTWWSARWTGAIYLDLAASDRKLQTIVGNGDNVRIWVGRRAPGEVPFFAPNNGTTTSTGLRAHLGSVAGWYPIIIEYRHAHSPAGLILKDGAVGFGSYSVVPAERLSPYGVFQDKVQHESHRSMIDRITQEFGYQWTIEPQSLESGSFPGRLVPRVRQGTDRNVRLGDADGATSGLRASGNAADASVRLLIDAAGLAAPGGEGSTTAEAWDFPGAADAFYVATAWEGAPEITDTALALQRAESLLALHAGPTQTVSANPSGDRVLTDTWPITGELSRIEWEPGDAPFLDFPNIAVVDRSPRQLTAVTWPCRPSGIGAPEATWVNKPKGQRTIARRALQGVSAARRNYQGQFGLMTGAIGGSSTTLAPDAYSRLFTNPTRIVTLAVSVDGAFSGTVEVNGVNTGLKLTASTLEPLDVTAWKSSGGQQHARLVSATGAHTLQLVARVLV